MFLCRLAGAVCAVQVLSEFVLSGHGVVPVHSSAASRLPVHLLGSTCEFAVWLMVVEFAISCRVKKDVFHILYSTAWSANVPFVWWDFLEHWNRNEEILGQLAFLIPSMSHAVTFTCVGLGAACTDTEHVPSLLISQCTRRSFT